MTALPTESEIRAAMREMEADGEWELWRELNSFLPRSDTLLAGRLAWWGDASEAEVMAFGLAVCTCGTCPPDRDDRPDGSNIPRYSDVHLREHLTIAVQRGQDRAARTRWLEQYTEKLVAESRLRRGAA